MSRDCLRMVSNAYLVLLQIPATDLLRARNQSTYAELLEYISKVTNRDPEDVQDTYEEIARVLRESLEWHKRKQVPPNTIN